MVVCTVVVLYASFIDVLVSLVRHSHAEIREKHDSDSCVCEVRP